MVLRLVTCLMIAAATIVSGRGAQQPAPTATLLERASRYAADYEQAFSAVVSEEHQVQTLIRPDGRVRQVRDLKSDFLLVKTAAGTQAFRDVIEVDRQPVRKREDRLRKLFLDAKKNAVEQARAIAKESERYNIGIQRTGNSPFLPLLFLKPQLSSGFQFTSTDATLAYQEVRTPSVLSQRAGATRYDLMSKGTYQLESESGRVLAAEFTTLGGPPTYAMSLAVRYDLHKTLALMVPTDVQERYWSPHKPKDDRLEANSTYTNFRRFEVTVVQQIK